MENKPKNTYTNSQWFFALRQILRWSWNILYRIGVVLVILMLIFQIPYVQRKLVDTLTASISSATNQEVEIGSSYLLFFDRLLLTDVYVEDYCGDTLAQIDRLQVNFDFNPFVIWRNGLVVEGLSLSGANLFNTRYIAEGEFTLAHFIQQLAGEPKEEPQPKKPTSFSLKVGYLSLEEIHFISDDRLKGNYLEAQLETGAVLLKDLNLQGPIIDVEKAYFDGFTLVLENRPSLVPIVPQEKGDDDKVNELMIFVDDFDLVNGHFVNHNYSRSPTRSTPSNILDYDHMDVADIKIDIECFVLEEEVYTGKVNHLSAKAKSGFELNKLAVQNAEVSSKGINLYGLDLITPDSHVGDTLQLKYKRYEAFSEFVDEVKITADISNSTIALSDIMVFAPQLNENNFFDKNRHTTLDVEGVVKGRVNDLRSKRLVITLPDGSLIDGKFSSNNLAVRQEEFVDLKLNKLTTSVQTLKELIPNFSPPDNFYSLGNLNFSGRFTGFFADFVADGDLTSDIGHAQMDMRMDIKNGVEKASYSGALELNGFDLGKWANSEDLGLVSLKTQVEEGVGLKRSVAQAKLKADIYSFWFKGYHYQNAELAGTLNEQAFAGEFAIADENIDLAFKGTIDIEREVPLFNFESKINRLKLKQLNLSKTDLSLSCAIDLNIENERKMGVLGDAQIKDLNIQKEDKKYIVDLIEASSKRFNDKIKQLSVKSDILTVDLLGEYKLADLPRVFDDYFTHNYTEFTDRLGWQNSRDTIVPLLFEARVNVVDSKGLNWLLSERLGDIQEAELALSYDAANSKLDISATTPTFRFDDMAFTHVDIDFKGQDSLGHLMVSVGETIKKEKSFLQPIDFDAQLNGDSLFYSIVYADTSTNEYINQAHIDGGVYLQDSVNVALQFDSLHVNLLEEHWQLAEEGKIVLGKASTVQIPSFKLFSGDKRLSLRHKNEQGIIAEVAHLNFSLIDKFWEFKPLDFSGDFGFRLELDNVFKQKGLAFYLTGDEFFINDDHYGALNLKANAVDLKSKLTSELFIAKGEQQLLAKGSINLGEKKSKLRIPRKRNQQYYVDYIIKAANYPLSFAEYFVSPNVYDVEGTFDANLGLKGLFPEPDVSGEIVAKDGAFFVDYLKTRYTFETSIIEASNKMFDASGTVLYDKYHHTATVKGGISHYHLQDLGVAAKLKTDRFLALDTKKGDNSLFYGHALGAGDISFDGLFSRIHIYVNAVVGDSTQISMPITSSTTDSELKGVTFVNKHKKKKEVTISDNVADEITGVSFEMDLQAKEQAEMRMIFDEQSGDVIKGQGRGNIRMNVPVVGDVEMYGNYTILKGDYLFTLYDIINKQFTVKEGGIIVWDGDPLGAQISLQAEYAGLKAPLTNFIQEHIQNNEQLLAESREATEIQLGLNLDGELFKPDISFELGFPALTGRLKSAAESKLRLVEADPDEMNRQVFGLVLVGQFLPSDILLEQGNVGSAITNTVSEMFSNQFSLLLNQWFNETFGEQDINFAVAYSQHQGTDATEGTDFKGNDLELSITKNFLNDRLTISVGGNLGFGNTLLTDPNNQSTGTFVGNDVVIEYAITKNRALKLRVYQGLDPTINGNKLKIGTGLSYRKEFNSFDELWRKIKEDFK